jgi:hypothetical protein
MLVLITVFCRMPAGNRFQVYSAGLIIDGDRKNKGCLPY